MPIAPQAVVHPTARVAPDVEIGPFTVVEAGASIGAGCKIASRVTIKSGVVLGEANLVEEGAVIGGMPQHLVRPEAPGPVFIGDRNVIRENVTIHRAMETDGATRIGSDCLLMVGSHVAHDCTIADNVVLTNNVMLAGHVTVGERAYLGGGVAVHQHCRIGRLAMVGGMARVPQDVPPFVMIDGGSGLVVGLNRVGLRRAGLDRNQISDLKQAYQLLYRSGLTFDERIERIEATFAEGPVLELAEFFRGGVRGFTSERRTPPGATIRVVTDADDAADAKRKAG
ncbi:MAG: acyl-ACP--UDP-N-acetylglucosamine O-acyltransferase [Planctomycetota bacterium]